MRKMSDTTKYPVKIMTILPPGAISGNNTYIVKAL